MVLGGEVTASQSATPIESLARDVSIGSSKTAIDLVIRWGDWVLSAHELSPPRTFVLAEQGGDVTLPAQLLGADRVPILLGRWDGDVRLVVPRSARVLLGGRTKRLSAAKCIARGLGEASTTVPDAAEIQLLPGQTATLFFQTLAIDITCATAAPQMPRAKLAEKRVVLAQIGSLFAHLLVLGLLAFFRPLPNLDPDGGMSDDQKFEFQQRLYDAIEKDWDLRDAREGYLRRGRRNERRLLAALSNEKQDAWVESFESRMRGWSSQLAAQSVRDEAPREADRGVIGLLYDWPTPEPARTASPTRDRSTTATLAADNQTGGGRPPALRMGAVSVSGNLPPEVIQRIVRQNFGRFRLCYENGLRNNPNLQGRVSVRFVIGRDGAISNVGNAGSDMPDSGVVSCIVRAFYTMSFPQPESGIVTVVYPLKFSPGG